MRQLLPRVNSRNPLLSAVTKLMNRLIGERDWSAQEVCHLLLNLSLEQGSRSVVPVDLRPEDQQGQRYTFSYGADAEQPESVQATRSWLRKYKERPQRLSQLSYLEFLQWFNVAGDNYTERRRERVLNFFPLYKDKSFRRKGL